MKADGSTKLVAQRVIGAVLLCSLVAGCGGSDVGILDLSHQKPSAAELLGPAAAPVKGKSKKKTRYAPPLDVSP